MDITEEQQEKFITIICNQTNYDMDTAKEKLLLFNILLCERIKHKYANTK